MTEHKHRYKIYVKDNKVNATYPIIITDKSNIFDLMKWLNDFVKKYDVNILGGEVQDRIGATIDKIHFLPLELKCKYFYTTPSARLLCHYHDYVEEFTV